MSTDWCILTIDLHRGHLDPEMATLPLPRDRAERVTSAAVSALEHARSLGIPVVHVITSYRNPGESLSNPFWARIEKNADNSRSNMGRHNIEGSPGTELMPGIFREGDIRVYGKKRYDSFLDTDLKFVLDSLGARTLGIMGVNTNSCVLTTTLSASTKDYDPIVIEECVDTLDDPKYHDYALELIKLAFGRVMKTGDFFEEYRKTIEKSNRTLK